MTIKFNIAEICLCTEAEGPGRRLAIWFQGCNILCEGCCNIDMQPLIIKHLISNEDLIEIIKESAMKNHLEGVTLLGGEPTIQKGLAHLSHMIKELGMGVILFTGRLVEELPSDLLDAVDLVIDGHYDEFRKDHIRNSIGSINQRMVHITGRYKDMEAWYRSSRPMHVEINNDNQNLIFTGDVFYK